MKYNKRIIGICLTRAEDEFKTDFLAHFHPTAEKNGLKTIVFNCPRDLYYGDTYDNGARSVFDIINYDMLDVLVVLNESFYDNNIKEHIIGTAYEHDVPVILVHGEHKGCCCIVSDYTDAYKEMIRHLFECHKIKKPVFIGGKKDDDVTGLRLSCFKSVIEEYGIAYSDSMTYYGDYWDIPTCEAVRKILASPEGVPDAVVCANDTMAMAACETLRANGLRVPEDVIVTGFDGLVSAEYFMPRLTTCREDIGHLTDMTMDIIGKILSGEVNSGVFTEKFVPYISESCGCMDDNLIDYRERARALFTANYDTRQHEGHVYKWVDSVLDSDSINTLSSALSDYILPNSSVCLNESFIMTALSKSAERSKETSFNEYIVISSMSENYSNGKQGRFPAADMVPDVGTWLEDNTLCVLTPIFVGDENCGFYAVKTNDISVTAQKLFRVSKTMNIAFGALLNRILKTNMQSTMINASFTDQLTGLPNLKGLTKWFNEFSGIEKNHEKTVMVSVYNIPQYKFIFENYGMDDIEAAVKFTADALRLANKDNGFIARTGNDEFIIFNYVDNAEDVSIVIDNAVSVFYGIIEGYNTSSDKDYFLEVNCGCTVANTGWNSSLSSLIKLANAEMYMNKLKAGMTPVMKDEKLIPQKKNDVRTPQDMYSEFSILIEKNLFTYFFQPIIDAKTGEIYAYEALMRTKGGIKMNPLEILDIAKEYNMLYDIEKATMFNVMERYERERDIFKNRKVFINTIPGNFLKKHDLAVLKEKYGRYISNFVFELTEQDTVSDEELGAMNELGVVGNTEEFRDKEGGQIAVDDYGTGHSNIVNLLRYAPHVIKIDRFLITNIQNDPNKQMFVKSTIEFAKMNNIKVLAEGVETYDEMRTVIDYGVDLIQGYYTARPAEELIDKIPDSIRSEVISENLLLSRFENDLLVYSASDNETVSLYDLAIGKYGCTHVMGGKVRFTGTEGQTFDTEIKVEKNCTADIILDNVRIKAIDEPAIKLGQGSRVTLHIVGKNSIQKNGILVPSGASLKIVGDGELDISVKRNGGTGIGNYFDGSVGNISFEHTGLISVEMQIDRGICIGGGSPSYTADIRFADGQVNLTAQCVNSLGIGCIKGTTNIFVGKKASVTARCSGKNAVGVGTFDGNVSIKNEGILSTVSDGDCCAAIGSIGSGSAEIVFAGGESNAVVHSSNAACIGTVRGKANISIVGGRVTAYGEGDTVCGYGSVESSGVIHISGGSANVKILSGNAMQFGSARCRTVITGGSVCAEDEGNVMAVNEFGDTLRPFHPDGNIYRESILTHKGEYLYEAEKLSENDTLCVFIP